MRYAPAIIGSIVAFLLSVVTLGVLIGQSLDNVQGRAEIIPAIGELALCLAVAVWTFRTLTKRP